MTQISVSPNPASVTVTASAGRWAWGSLAILVSTLLFAFVNRQVLTLVAAPLQASLGISDQQLGLLQGGAFALFTVMALYPLGWLADRVDRRWVLGGCIVVWATGTVLCGLAQDFPQLFLGVMLLAAGEAGLGPIILATIPDLFPGPDRIKANFIFYAATFMGASAGFALGGIAIAALDAAHGSLPPSVAAFESWRLAFFLVAAPAPFFALLVGLMRLPPRAVAAVDEPPASLKAYLRAHGVSVGLVIGSATLFSAAFAGYGAWLPVATARQFGTSPAENGAAMAILLAVAGLSGLAGGIVAMRVATPRYGLRAPLRVGSIAMALAAPFALLVPFVTAAWQIYMIVGVQLFVGTVYGSILPNVLQVMVPADVRTRMFSLYSIAVTLTTGMAIWLTGAISSMAASDGFLLSAIAIVSFPAWVLAALLTRAAELRFDATIAALAAADPNVAGQRHATA